MNNTNAIPVIAQVVQGAGFHITEGQLAVILSAGAATLRWLSLEFKIGWKQWGAMGGLTGLKAYFSKGGTP